MRHVHDGDGAGHGVDEDDDVGDEFGVAAQLEEAGAFDDGGADGSRGVRRVRGGRQRVKSGHGDAHELALLVAAGCPVFEEFEGGHGDGRVAVACHPGLVNDVGAEGVAQPREVACGDVGDPQAYAALNGVVEFVGEGVSGGGVGREAFGGDV